MNYNNYNHQEYIGTNKPLPKCKFKVGDWIEIPIAYAEPVEIAKITDDNYLITKGLGMYAADYCRLWKPILGKHVILQDYPINGQHNYPIIAKFGGWVKLSSYDHELPTTTDGIVYDLIAPFRDNIPDYMQES